MGDCPDRVPPGRFTASTGVDELVERVVLGERCAFTAYFEGVQATQNAVHEVRRACGECGVRESDVYVGGFGRILLLRKSANQKIDDIVTALRKIITLDGFEGVYDFTADG